MLALEMGEVWLRFVTRGLGQVLPAEEWFGQPKPLAGRAPLPRDVLFGDTGVVQNCWLTNGLSKTALELRMGGHIPDGQQDMFLWSGLLQDSSGALDGRTYP